MDKLREKLYKEMESWVSDLVTDSDLPKRELLSAYAYEYCIKDEFIDFFDGCNDRRCRKYKRRKELIKRWRRKNGNFRCIGNNVYCPENTWVNTVVMVMGT